jgi:hypothetical protein
MIIKVILDDYCAASTWLAPNSGEGRENSDRFLWRGMDGTFILRVL